MEKHDVKKQDEDLLQLGQPPLDPQLLDTITVGESVWETFVGEQYLAPAGYIADGYSQMKFVIGRPGAGKTHLLRRLTGRANLLGYSTVYLSASDFRLQHIETLYAGIAGHIDFKELTCRLARRAVGELGYELRDVPAKTTFLSWVVREHHRIDTLVKREVAEVLGHLFKGERVEPNFSLAFTQLASDLLGTHPLSPEDRILLHRWLCGEKLRAEELHRIHLARRIDRYNARDMLHALATFLRQQGYTGLFVAIDQMEDLPAGRNPETGRLKYGGIALADAYQSLREMVDNLPTISGMMIILAGRPEFLELQRGIKSYDALWLRIQHEIVSPSFNRFAQVLDLDRAVQTNLAPTDLQSLHQRLTALGLRIRPFDELPVEDIMATAAGDGVYRRLMKAMLG
jgi:hypothetical protein